MRFIYRFQFSSLNPHQTDKPFFSSSLSDDDDLLRFGCRLLRGLTPANQVRPSQKHPEFQVVVVVVVGEYTHFVMR